MSMEAYDHMSNTGKIDAAINEAEVEYNSNGESYDVEEAFSMLRRKHFG